MSNLDGKTLDNLADMVYNVLWIDILEIFKVVREKMDTQGQDAVKAAFVAAEKRFVEGPFAEHVEVRWGMNLCVHCNDDNIEKNGIAYLKPNGDGLEFNQCLNCRVGILYNLVTATATMDSYVIGLGKPGQFNGMSFYWAAIVIQEMKHLDPIYEVIKNGQWIGSVSFDRDLSPRFLAFESMKESLSRESTDPWTTEIPEEIQIAINQFISVAREQIEVALAIM